MNFKIKIFTILLTEWYIRVKEDNQMEINKVFRNNEFGELSVIVKDKKEYFEAIPVATILGYQNPRGGSNWSKKRWK